MLKVWTSWGLILSADFINIPEKRTTGGWVFYSWITATYNFTCRLPTESVTRPRLDGARKFPWKEVSEHYAHVSRKLIVLSFSRFFFSQYFFSRYHSAHPNRDWLWGFVPFFCIRRWMKIPGEILKSSDEMVRACGIEVWGTIISAQVHTVLIFCETEEFEWMWRTLISGSTPHPPHPPNTYEALFLIVRLSVT